MAQAVYIQSNFSALSWRTHNTNQSWPLRDEAGSLSLTKMVSVVLLSPQLQLRGDVGALHVQMGPALQTLWFGKGGCRRKFNLCAALSAGSLHCWSGCKERSQLETYYSQPQRQDLDHGGWWWCLCGLQVTGTRFSERRVDLQCFKKIIDAASGKETPLKRSFPCRDCLRPLQNEDTAQVS